MQVKIKSQPLSVAVRAGSKTWQFYKSGVVREDDGCKGRSNHVVVIVGYYDDEPEDDSNDSDDCENWEYAEQGQRLKWFNYNPC